MIINEDAYLEHYGVKGMKWGVRKEQRAYKMKRTAEQKMENKARRKAGKGTKAGKKVGVGERARTAYDFSQGLLTPSTIKDLIVTRSINQSQLRKAERIQGRIARRKQGKASVGDNLAYLANMRYQDFAPTRSSPTSTKINVGASAASALLSSATFGISDIASAGAAVVSTRASKQKPARRSKKGG